MYKKWGNSEKHQKAGPGRAPQSYVPHGTGGRQAGTAGVQRRASAAWGSAMGAGAWLQLPECGAAMPDRTGETQAEAGVCTSCGAHSIPGQHPASQNPFCHALPLLV